jgi:hypothetical protein
LRSVAIETAAAVVRGELDDVVAARGSEGTIAF